MTNKERIFLYHADCSDGFGSAYAAWKKFKNKAKYIPVRHGEKLPEGLAGCEVYTLDFCYKGEDFEYLLKNTDLVVIDHHISAKSDVERAPNFSYALKNSGAVLTWKYFHGEKEIPELLKFIEDKDLWNFKFKETDFIRERLEIEKMDFKVWDVFMKKLQNKKTAKSLIKEGQLLVKSRNSNVKILLEKSYEVEFDGLKCRAVNSPVFHSELGYEMAKMGYPVGIVWKYNGNKITVSLRSDGKTDVSVMAAKYGGGGHRAASGFAVDNFNNLPWRNIVS
ncbi:MAG: hypothetical protein EXS49_02355 [Candidatus Pacebacteria bacterium]|nr:hypothetical protein [Candidatus Paceibacterota bacterium]